MDDTLNKTPQGGAGNPSGDDHLDAEALYTRGMAHYRRREWQRAMEYFVRLKALEANRPGIDALLDELDWFIQLQAMGPEGQSAEADAAGGRQPAEPDVREVSPPRPKTKPLQRRFKWRWLIWPLALIAIAAGVVLLIQVQQPDPIEALYNRAQAKMTVGDYEGAIQIYEEILERDPSHKGAQFALEKARRQSNLGLLYQNAQTYIANEQWDLASAELKKILEIDSSYMDASILAQTVERRKTVSDLFKEGVAYFQGSEWGKAIDRLERARSLDATYKESELRSTLFNAYVNESKRLLDDLGSQAAEVRSAIQNLSSALTLQPQSQAIADIKRDAEAYLAGMVAYGNGEFDLAVARFKNLYDSDNEYVIRNAAQWLYDTYIARGDAYRDGGRYTEALAQYQQAQAIEGVDTGTAEQRVEEIFTQYATRTPTVTPTPTATPTRVPTKTPVPPTATKVPPTLPPPPTQAPPTNTPRPPTPTVAPTDTPVPPTPTRPPH
jgi:tetratricopeptide (TPR) repeat protein